MSRKDKFTFTTAQKLDCATLMHNENYSNQEIVDISGASKSAVSRWRQQYKQELDGIIPEGKSALTPDKQRIQGLEK